jgi:hypothetical protein
LLRLYRLHSTLIVYPTLRPLNKMVNY